MLFLTSISENDRKVQNVSYAADFLGKMTVKYILQFAQGVQQ